MEIYKTVKHGPIEISVRAFSDGRYGFDWKEGGKRKQGRWRDPKDAVDEAKERAKFLAAGKIQLLNISPERFAEFQKWLACQQQSKPVEEIRDELLDFKRNNEGLDAYYVDQLEFAWNLLCKQFPERLISEITSGDLERWITKIDKSARTKNNIRSYVVQLFRFARKRGYLPDATTEAEKVDAINIKRQSGDIPILTPDELREFFKSASQELVPWLILGAFAGIRTEEMRPKPKSKKDGLRWEDIKHDEKQICLRAETSKIGRTRFIPIADNLAKWLLPYAKKTGLVIDIAHGTFFERLKKLRRDLGKTDEQNLLRHSFGSYRNAIIRNIGQLAEEMGNSPAIAKRNYENPQPRTIAEEWFGILP